METPDKWCLEHLRAFFGEEGVEKLLSRYYGSASLLWEGCWDKFPDFREEVIEKIFGTESEFDGLVPGTSPWHDYWRDHPHQQRSMVKRRELMTRAKVEELENEQSEKEEEIEDLLEDLKDAKKEGDDDETRKIRRKLRRLGYKPKASEPEEEEEAEGEKPKKKSRARAEVEETEEEDQDAGKVRVIVRVGKKTTTFYAEPGTEIDVTVKE